MTKSFATSLQAVAPYPLLGRRYQPEDFALINLHDPQWNRPSSDLLTYEGLRAFIQDSIARQGGRVGYGGYAEDRILYRASKHFATPEGHRSIHLGIDLWASVGTPIYTPLPGWLHSFQDNANYLDYGPTIILEHRIGKQSFHTLYGHLSRLSLRGLVPGQPYRKGDLLGRIGAPEENLGWVPHLHFQCILDMGDYAGDYPGVALPNEAKAYLANCPDPGLLLTMK